jgi:hypothetical protein
VPTGRDQLNRDFYPMDGSNNPRGEFWIRKRDQLPVFVPFAGPPFNGQDFDKEALDAILATG